MNIHTRKRAMLMRSVDRRNAVSAQEPKKFALSSQRKLSVLLVVGIIILSAKECEMKPVGPGGDKPVTFDYICTNGTVADGTAKVKNTEKCSACDSGFELNSAKACVASVGTIAYICTNGIIAEGVAPTASTEKCSACDAGFELNSANACVASVGTIVYICTNGIIAEGVAPTASTEKCSACDAGFELDPANTCVVDITAPAVVTLTTSLPSVGTVGLSWTEPADADFSHLLISWTPNLPDAPIQVNKGTTTTVIAASGLTSGTPYTFTAISVDTTGNESAASTGAMATPLSCPNPLFATTTGGPYTPQANVASGSGAVNNPRLIPLVDGIHPTCPIIIEVDSSSLTLAGSLSYYRIDNMPIGATYTSSTLAWNFKMSVILIHSFNTYSVAMD